MTKSVVLTIGGFDPSTGAGICADIKTFNFHKIYAVSVITAVAIQNTLGVVDVVPINHKAVNKQLICLNTDFNIKGIKISMIYTKETASVISSFLKNYAYITVYDPVIKSKNGFYLMKKEDIETIIELLFPLCFMVTPNIHEAEILTGIKIKTPNDMLKAAEMIKKLGPKTVVVKGGHLENEEYKQDVFFNGKESLVLKGEVKRGRSVHGTGCAFSSSILANLVKGKDVITSLKNAKEYISYAISNSLELGKGYRLINHFTHGDGYAEQK